MATSQGEVVGETEAEQVLQEVETYLHVQVVYYKFQASDLGGHKPGGEVSEDEAEHTLEEGGPDQETQPAENETAQFARDALQVSCSLVGCDACPP